MAQAQAELQESEERVGQLLSERQSHARAVHAILKEYAKLVAEASEDERSRRVRIETLRALQGGSQLPWL